MYFRIVCERHIRCLRQDHRYKSRTEVEDLYIQVCQDEVMPCSVLLGYQWGMFVSGRNNPPIEVRMSRTW